MINFKATVIKGQGKGREIGFPTINLELTSPTWSFWRGTESRPARIDTCPNWSRRAGGELSVLNHGVYLCKVKQVHNAQFSTLSRNPAGHLSALSSQLSVFFGIMHYGKRETMNLPESIEIHLFDYKGGDLYGIDVEVEVLSRIRDVQKFCSIDDLKKQIKEDVKNCKSLLLKNNVP